VRHFVALFWLPGCRDFLGRMLGGMPPFKVHVNWRVVTHPDLRAVVKAGSEESLVGRPMIPH
jgi:hypothetical protein